MTYIKNIFFYKSIDLKDYDLSHEVKILKRIGRRKVLVSFDPPLPCEIYKTRKNIDQAILIPRYPSLLFLPALIINKICVNLCLSDDESDFSDSSLRIIDIGDLKKTWRRQ